MPGANGRGKDGGGKGRGGKSGHRRAKGGTGDAGGGDAGQRRAKGGGGNKGRQGGKILFDDYLTEEEVAKLEAEGAVHRGAVRINPKNFEQGFVPGGKRFPVDVLIPGFKERNRALDGDEVAVLLADKAEWVVQETSDLARPLRFRTWANPAALSPKCQHPEFLVVCAPLTADQVVDVNKHLLSAGVTTSELDVVADTGALHICCRDEAQAQRVMALDGLRVASSELALTRGDGELLPLEQLPPRFVQPVGRVVLVTPRDADRTFCGTLRTFGKQTALFVSKDRRVPRIIVPLSSCPPDFVKDPAEFGSTLVAARLTSWPRDGVYAQGEVQSVVGKAGDVHAEVKAILLENDVDDSDFPPGVLDSLPKLDEHGQWHIPAEELARRRDLRDSCIFTIDPATARDLDDALSFRKLDDGGVEVGVHIADVTYFLKPETELYSWASRRATSTYLVNKCYPMLPRLLCENLCSLAENEDRLAFSVVWRFDANGKVVDEWFGRTVIRSCVKLAYEHAQAVIEAPDLDWAAVGHPAIHNGVTVEQVKASVLGLYGLSKILRERRFDSGAIRLDKIKVAFRLDRETGLPTECFNYTTRDSNKLVEEFMLLANMAVARRIYDQYPEIALLRRHEPPLDTKLEEVIDVCRRMGFEFEGGTSGELHRSLRRLGQTMDEVQFRTVQLLCMAPMQVAQYVCTGTLDRVDEARHYALAVPFYTHFTSPIRRMADVVVHHLLDCAITGETPWYSFEEVKRQASICNTRKAAAKKAQEDSEYLYMCLYIDAHAPIVEEASVCRVQDRSLDILTLRHGVETRLRLDDMTTLEKYTYDRAAGTIQLLYKDGRHDVVSLLSKLTVELTVAKDGPKMDVVATLVPNPTT
eukprot:m.161844 g.161844  ORF g.161844 m.161844 type:complete len:869 (+) comp12118_c0_seq1:252-2858(+)